MFKSLAKAWLWDSFAIIVVWYARFVQQSFLGLAEAILQSSFSQFLLLFPPSLLWFGQ